jgi:hypothetical protein
MHDRVVLKLTRDGCQDEDPRSGATVLIKNLEKREQRDGDKTNDYTM